MRPQLTPLPDDISGLAALADEQLEDLGWNDMGAEGAEGPESDLDPSTDPENLLIATKPSAKPAAGTNDLYDTENDNCDADDSDEDAVDAQDTDQAPHPILDPVTSADIVPIGARSTAPVPANEDTSDSAEREETPLADADSPVVRSQQKRLARRILADAATPLSKAKPRSKNGRRAAFTLRLDTDRHLKLRLASTMKGMSAQSLVTQALDSLLDDIAELDTLVERMKRD